MGAVYFFLKDHDGCFFAVPGIISVRFSRCQIRIVKVVQHIRRPRYVRAVLHGAVGAAIPACVPVGDVFHRVGIHHRHLAHLVKAGQLLHGVPHPVAGLGHSVGFQIFARPHPVHVFRKAWVNALFVFLNAGVLRRGMYRRVIVHRRLLCLLCRRSQGSLPEGAVARRRLREFAPQSSPFGGAVSALRCLRGFVPLHRLTVRCLQRRAHPAQLGAHSAAQRAGSAAGKAAFQRLQKGVSAEHLLGRLRVAQGRVNGLVRIGLHKGLHGIVNAAGHRIRHRRVLLRQYAVVCHAAHHVRQLPRQRVLGVVAAHGPGKVCRAHAVDGPPRTELCKAAHQRLARALALVNALAHSLRAALGAQHRQHQRRADARHC